MKDPKVSIVIPVYNGSRYLSEAVDSALKQTYKNLEVIVVNDGSNDGGKTEKSISLYGDKIRYFYKENGGVASALNLGIKQMTGEWFSWLSHDDVYFKDKIDEQIAFIKRNPKARFLFSPFILIDEAGEKLREKVYQWTPDPDIPLIRQLLEGNKINGCTTLIHKSCFEKVGLFNERNKMAQDYEMWLMLSAYFKLYHCPELVLKSRIHKEMGSLIFAGQTGKYTALTIRNADKRLTLPQIFPDKLTEESNKKELRKYHLELANLYLKNHGLIDLAKKHHLPLLKVIWSQILYSLSKLIKDHYYATAWKIFCLLKKIKS